jgi:hypothetical protein
MKSLNTMLEENLKDTLQREFIHSNIDMVYKKPGVIDKQNYYMIIDIEDFYYFEMIKHIEHVPLQSYEEILNVDINKNVW